MKRLVLIAFGLLLGLTQVHAEPPTCHGTDLLAKLQADDPVAYREIIAAADAVPNGNAIFWKIERDGLEPSWLLGTAHVTDIRVTELSSAMQEALDGADTVALELKELRNQQEFMATAFRNANLMVLPPGQSLWDLIPDDQEHLIRNNPNLPPGTENTLFGYQPWVVVGMVTIPPCEVARKKAGIVSLDMAIAARADRHHIRLEGLETVKEQLSVFANMPLDLQAKYLVSAASVGAGAADYFETLISLYQQRKVTALMPLTLKLTPMGEDGDRMMVFVEEDLIRKRNRTMVDRAEKILSKGNAFIAVGALHLPGNEGLVELIRRAGYKVTPVN